MFLRKKAGPVAWITVFLGNPGMKYAGTRHNVGFLTADFFAKTSGVKINRLKHKALTGMCSLGGQKVLLMKPQTYMNLSAMPFLRHTVFTESLNVSLLYR